tara:strand:+ start:1592 stop:2938 length:1347 start_codon:yes stop_codon:yes gene_type:complete
MACFSLARLSFVIAFALVVGGCGGGNGSSDESSAAGSAATSVAADETTDDDAVPASSTTTTEAATTTTEATTTTTTTTVAPDPWTIDPRVTPATVFANPDECKIPDVTPPLGPNGEELDTVYGSRSGFPRESPIDPFEDLQLLVVPASVDDSVFVESDLAVVEEAFATVADFYLDQSYGRATVEATIVPEAAWVSLEGSAEDVGLAGGGFDTDRAGFFAAVVAAVAADVDLSSYDAVAVVTHQDPNLAFGQGFDRIDGERARPPGMLLGGVYLPFWSIYAHELGHVWLLSEDLYYFPDLSQIMMGGWDLMENTLNQTLEINPWTRWINGWVADAQVDCITAPGSTTHAIETVSLASERTKMVVVKLSDHSVLVVDSRRDLGFGEQGWDANGDAAIVYVVDTSIRHGMGPIRWRGELRQIGESLTTDGVTITLDDADQTNDLVTVTVSD